MENPVPELGSQNSLDWLFLAQTLTCLRAIAQGPHRLRHKTRPETCHRPFTRTLR